MAAPLTKALSHFVSELEFDSLPDTVVDIISDEATDCVAAMLAGSREQSVLAIRRSRITPGRVHEARLLLGNEKGAAVDAALVNGAAAHALDIGHDDSDDYDASHVLLPAILAEAEVVGASGRDIVAAYAAGYETWARMAERENDSYASKGWYGNAAIGVVAAAAAIANLRRLVPTVASNAMGIAAIMSGGTVAACGYGTEALQVGRAAANGILACRMAVTGVTAAPDLLERSKRSAGLLAALSPRGNVDVDRDVDDLGRSWRLQSGDYLPSGRRPETKDGMWRQFSARTEAVVPSAVAHDLFERLQEIDRVALIGELSSGVH